jgi:hypothetical protein
MKVMRHVQGSRHGLLHQAKNAAKVVTVSVISDGLLDRGAPGQVY